MHAGLFWGFSNDNPPNSDMGYMICYMHIIIYIVTKHIVCVLGYDPLTFFFPVSFPFWLGGSFMAPII